MMNNEYKNNSAANDGHLYKHHKLFCELFGNSKYFIRINVSQLANVSTM